MPFAKSKSKGHAAFVTQLMPNVRRQRILLLSIASSMQRSIETHVTDLNAYLFGKSYGMGGVLFFVLANTPQDVLSKYPTLQYLPDAENQWSPEEFQRLVMRLPRYALNDQRLEQIADSTEPLQTNSPTIESTVDDGFREEVIRVHSVTPFAKRRARAEPLFSAVHPSC